MKSINIPYELNGIIKYAVLQYQVTRIDRDNYRFMIFCKHKEDKHDKDLIEKIMLEFERLVLIRIKLILNDYTSVPLIDYVLIEANAYQEHEEYDNE